MRPQIPKTIWAILIILILMTITSMVVAIHNPGGVSYPRVIAGPRGPKGDSPSIDYGRLELAISRDIAKLPIPKDGINGRNGLNGKDGKNGKDGTRETNGLSGDPGIAGKSIEIRHNDALHRTEWRYTGDFGWKILVNDCTILNNCESL